MNEIIKTDIHVPQQKKIKLCKHMNKFSAIPGMIFPRNVGVGVTLLIEWIPKE